MIFYGIILESRSSLLPPCAPFLSLTTLIKSILMDFSWPRPHSHSSLAHNTVPAAAAYSVAFDDDRGDAESS